VLYYLCFASMLGVAIAGIVLLVKVSTGDGFCKPELFRVSLAFYFPFLIVGVGYILVKCCKGRKTPLAEEDDTSPVL
jgi:hypothetical protein